VVVLTFFNNPYPGPGLDLNKSDLSSSIPKDMTWYLCVLFRKNIIKTSRH